MTPPKSAARAHDVQVRMADISECPKPGESIFSSDGPAQFRASTDYGRGDWLAFANGFRAVAERAAEHLEARRKLADNELYGFAYLWRHYLELALKTFALVMAETGELHAGEVDQLLKNANHFLVPFWEKLLPPLKAKPWGTSWLEDVALLDRVVRDFDALDRSSFELRYPSDKERKGTYLQGAGAFINVARLNRQMLWVGNKFEALYDALTNGDSHVFARVEDSPERRAARHTRRERELDEMYARNEPARRAAEERSERKLRPRR